MSATTLVRVPSDWFNMFDHDLYALGAALHSMRAKILVSLQPEGDVVGLWLDRTSRRADVFSFFLRLRFSTGPDDPNCMPVASLQRYEMYSL